MAKPAGDNIDDAAEDRALKHAWEWFSLHAAQRMQSFNLLLLSIAFVLAGYGAAFQAGIYGLAAGIAFAGTVIAACFWLMDRRHRQLLEAGIVALGVLEARMASRIETPELELVKAVAKPRPRLSSFRIIVGTVAVLAVLGFAIGAVVAICFQLATPL